LGQIMVWASFVWIGLIVAGILFFAWQSRVVDEQAPRLVARVERAVRDAARSRPSLAESLTARYRVQSIQPDGGADFLASLPEVDGATAFSFRGVGADGYATLGYRGEELAEGVCVRATVWRDDTVTVARHRCGSF
jgi:hypothetical protein